MRSAVIESIFGATIFFGTDLQREKAAVAHHARFNFMSEARIRYSRDADQPTCPAAFRTRLFSAMSFSRS